MRTVGLFDTEVLPEEEMVLHTGAPGRAVEILNEKPEHRIILLLKAQGLSNREIAQRCGYGEAWVSQVLRQPWARERILLELQKANSDQIAALLRGELANSIFTLIEMRDTAPKASDRITAANSILNRFLGTPTQRVETQVTHLKPGQTVEDLDRTITELEAEEKRLLGER